MFIRFLTIFIISLSSHTTTAKSPLYYAADSKRKIATGNQSSASFSKSLLHYAAKGGHTQIVEKLIKYGANLNTMDMNNRTAFDIAKAKKYTRIVKKLIKHGANVNAKPGFLHTLVSSFWRGYFYLKLQFLTLRLKWEKRS